MIKEFHIRADNPKGLAYDEVHTGQADTIAAIRTIIRRGGVNVTVNRLPIPEHLYTEIELYKEA